MEKKYQIFISSTYEDLKEERKQIQDTILTMYQFPIGMEMFSAADEEQWEIIRETIDSSDYYVLIIGHRYGSVIKDGEYVGISYTQKEFYYALEKKIPVLAFLIDRKAAVIPENMEQDTDKKEKLEQFIEEVKRGRTVQWWVNKDDLANKVMNSLNKQIKRKNRPGWVRVNENEKICEPKIDIGEIINELQGDNIYEFKVFIKYVKDVGNYKVKFKNKFAHYIERSKINKEECMLKEAISEDMFYSKYYGEYEYEWFYIGPAIEIFYTKLGMDYSTIAEKKAIRYDPEYETAYKNYLIQDAWGELEQIEDDRKFIYGVYVLSKILTGKKQNSLKEDFDELINKLVYENYSVKEETEVNDNFKEMEENSDKERKMIHMSKDAIFNISGGQVNISSDNATINATQNNGVGVDELEDIIKEITEKFSRLDKKEADEIADILDMAKEELTKPEPKVSRLRNCLTLLAPMFAVSNGIPTLAMNLHRLQDYIMQYIK
ncbi:MAG: DUF4062 domain-containing protein [Lachnospiraceae bacterium]|nr:DUF4062 domain-containing protein [Lachnospiraceae bacterium]